MLATATNKRRCEQQVYCFFPAEKRREKGKKRRDAACHRGDDRCGNRSRRVRCRVRRGVGCRVRRRVRRRVRCRVRCRVGRRVDCRAGRRVDSGLQRKNRHKCKAPGMSAENALEEKKYHRGKKAAYRNATCHRRDDSWGCSNRRGGIRIRVGVRVGIASAVQGMRTDNARAWENSRSCRVLNKVF